MTGVGARSISEVRGPAFPLAVVLALLRGAFAFSLLSFYGRGGLSFGLAFATLVFLGIATGSFARNGL